jgi:hypothetical protein
MPEPFGEIDAAGLPAPLTPPDCDLRDFQRMMVDIGRLFGSSFNASASRNPLAWMVGHKLWYRSWHQVPAASLPDDDAELCHLAELGFDLKGFRAARPLAMRGWIKCSDGRLYHKVVAEVALESWLEKLAQRLSSGAGNAKKYGYGFDRAPIEAQIAIAADMLIRIAPSSKAIGKLKRRASQQAPVGSPAGTPDAVPMHSQETETGTGTGLEGKDPSQDSTGLRVIGGGAA